MNRPRTLAWAAALATALGSCAGTDEHTLPIGAVFSTSGALAEQGVAQLEAVRLAVDEINAKGGVRGQRLRLVYRDDGSDLRKTERAAAALKAEGVSLVIGSVGSRYTEKVADALIPSAVVVSGSASSASLTAYPDDGFLFRTCASDTGEGKLLAQRAGKLGITRMAVIHKQGEPGLTEAFEAAFESAGGKVTFHGEYERDPLTYGGLLRQAFATEPQAVLLDADPVSGADLILEYVGGFVGERATWFFTHALQSPSFVTAVGSHRFTFPHEGTGPGTPMGARYQAFAAAYATSFGAPPPVGAYTANVYDAVYLGALAMQAAGAGDAVALRDAMRAVSQGGTAYGPEDFAEASEALQAGKDVNFEGASGSVDLDAAGDTSAPFDLWKVEAGGISIVERAVRAPL